MTDTTPAEGTEGLSTAEALDALPIGAVVTDRHGDAITHDSPGVWTQSETASMGTARLLRYGPFRVIYRPSTDRPTPPVPAAEDDAWWQGLTEVGCDAGHVVYVDDGDGTVYACPVCALAQARQQVADLRDAVADVLGGNEVGPGRLRDRLRSALAGSGEQPGEMAAQFAYAERAGRVAAEQYRPAPVVPDSPQSVAEHLGDVARSLGVTTGWSYDQALGIVTALDSLRRSPTPVVPDSADVRERVRKVVDARIETHWPDAPNGCDANDRECDGYEGCVADVTDAVLAVVGQGVTAEHDPHAKLAPELVDLLAHLDANDEDDNYSKGQAAADIRAALRRACGCERGWLPHNRRCPERLDRAAVRPTGQEPTTRGAGA